MKSFSFCVTLFWLFSVSPADARDESPSDLGKLYRVLKKDRDVQLERLHEYAISGRYPRNMDYPGQRVPYFVDQFGTRCAVGQLMWKAGVEKAVAAIAAADNHVQVMDVHEGVLVEWVLRSGLTQEEAALIQPTYEFYFKQAEKERKRIQGHLLKVESQIRAQGEESLGRALRRYLDRAIDINKLTAKDAPVLFRALKDPEPNVRIGAAHAIGRLRIKAVDELSACLKDQSAEVRFWAAAALVDTLPSPRDPSQYRLALSALAKTLKEGDKNRRMLAVGRIGLMARAAQTAPGHRTILTEIRKALQTRVKKGSKDLHFLIQCMRHVANETRQGDRALAYGNVGRIFIELQAGNEVHAAALHLYPTQIQALLKNKPDLLMARNQFGETPLHLAARFRWTRMRQLLHHKPDLAAVTRLGRIPLHGAIWADIKGKVNARDRIFGWTPLHYAAQSGNYQLVQMLLKRGADPNASDEFGFTPLHIAAGCVTPEQEPTTFGPWQNSYLVEILVKGGAKKSAKDKSGRTPYEWAVKLGRKQMAEELKE